MWRTKGLWYGHLSLSYVQVHSASANHWRAPSSSLPPFQPRAVLVVKKKDKPADGVVPEAEAGYRAFPILQAAHFRRD